MKRALISGSAQGFSENILKLIREEKRKDIFRR
jgi:hypothetical protein